MLTLEIIKLNLVLLSHMFPSLKGGYNQTHHSQ